MLTLKNIVKDYKTGDNYVRALDGISLDFRKSEFVSVLGPSGCGKTTLLNIIGGLDQYTSGDLSVNGVSTKKFKDANWDAYRNHSIGFVFQSYNLIPHQTVLSNVELALTLSGISKKERRQRAVEALEKVGLGDQINKKPNQMSGGQMQRVAIARALVNDPEILLADEPTGALDTTTSVQIMEILKEISKDKLIIMVTHNPELAEKYSSRIIRLLDGKVIDDSDPYTAPEGEKKAAPEKKNQKGEKLRSMSFFTALSLSLNNLMTKKTRTFMTSFAGSIGIIGIALILSVSTGVNNYINAVQRETLASYPIQLQAETVDMSALVSSLMGNREKSASREREEGRVYESAVIADLMNTLNTTESTKNDLKAFKQYLESEDGEEIRSYLTSVQYSYQFDRVILTRDKDGKVVKSDVNDLFKQMSGGDDSAYSTSMNAFGGSSMSSSYDVWEEMLSDGEDGMPSSIVKDEYDLIYGNWPTAYNQILLVVNENNEISDLTLYALGLRTQTEMMKGILDATAGKTFDTDELGSWSFEEICAMDFRLLLAADCYDANGNELLKTDPELLFTKGTKLEVCGIIRPNPDATSKVLRGSIAYTAALTRYIIDETQNNDLLRRQLDNPDTDVLSGLPFKTLTTVEPTAEEKKNVVLGYFDRLPIADRAALYTKLASNPDEAVVTEMVNKQMSMMSVDMMRAQLIKSFAEKMSIDEEAAEVSVTKMSDEDVINYIRQGITEMVRTQIKTQAEQMLSQKSAEELSSLLGMMLETMTDEQFVDLYDNELPPQHSNSTYEKNLKKLGYVRLDSPTAISLFADTFEDKDEVARLISEYNETVEEEQQIDYTDYVALLMSSITTIINAISYVLIAFVAISLVVSSIMIGIITYISVLERTKEIGILRSIGASKKDVRRVFNAETLIVGFVAGMIGILATLLLNVVINIILHKLTEIMTLNAVLPVGGAIVLVVISMALTLIAGLFPAGFAAKRNPVEALRTE